MKDQLFNRKILFSLLTVVTCLGFTAMSYGAAVVSVDPATVESPAVGEQLMVNINIAGGASVAGYQATVNFDPTALSYVAGANADYLPAGAFAVPATATENSVTLAATALGGTSDGDGTLATVTFEVVEVKASTIGLTGVTISDALANALEITTVDGMVTAPAAEEPAEEPAVEEPAEEPAVEEPAVEEPAEEPAVEEPAVEEPVSQMFEITLTNLTEGVHGESGQTLSPAIFAAHRAGVKLFQVGQPANDAIVALAEGGSTAGLEALAAAAGANVAIAMNADMTRRYTMPGQSSTVTITADMVNSSLSVGSMLVSTNDAFIGLADLPLFDEAGMPVSATIDLNAYDAGSEDNTEMASDIPGPLGLDPEVDPPGSNARVPTEGGVITSPHPGIQGGADVSEAFAWTEPTAMLMITPVDAPAEPVVEEPVVEEPVVEEPVVEEPVVEEPTVTADLSFDIKLLSGLNMISIPLMPAEDYTAKSLADKLAATIVVRLDAATQQFVGYSVAEEGAGFSIEGGAGYIVNVSSDSTVTFTGKGWSNQSSGDAAAAPTLSTDKRTWAFVVTSDIQGMETGTGYTLVAENLRTGIIATETVTSAVKSSSAVWADLNRKSVVEAGDKLEITLYDERGNIVSGPFQRTVSTVDIGNAFLSLQLNVGDVRPKDTILAQNYPNPFNPETWIPYQLSKSADVSIHIHNVAGHLVRTLDLGLKSTGSYMTPSTAAYWDGKNSAGERVASGIYFYTLQTVDFAATRRMVILK